MGDYRGQVPDVLDLEIPDLHRFSTFEQVQELMNNRCEYRAVVWRYMRKIESRRVCTRCEIEGKFCSTHCRDNFRYLYMNMFIYGEHSLRQWAATIGRNAYIAFWATLQWRDRWLNHLYELENWVREEGIVPITAE